MNRETARTAAEQANKLFGQWMPQRWLDLFLDSYEDIEGCRDAAQSVSTPSARWRANGEADPHGNQYDCERAKLAHGDMTDDEIANALFLKNYDIGIITAAKERIRWLSRALEKAAGVQPSSAERAQALRLLMAEDERQSKLHDLLETIREQIRTGVEPEHRPGGLFKNIQDAVYAMRGRTRLMDDGAITKIFDGQQEARKPPIETTGNGTGNGRTIKPELTGSPSGTPHGAGDFVPPAERWVVGKNGWDASDEATREDI